MSMISQPALHAAVAATSRAQRHAGLDQAAQAWLEAHAAIEAHSKLPLAASAASTWALYFALDMARSSVHTADEHTSGPAQVDDLETTFASGSLTKCATQVTPGYVILSHVVLGKSHSQCIALHWV